MHGATRSCRLRGRCGWAPWPRCMQWHSSWHACVFTPALGSAQVLPPFNNIIMINKNYNLIIICWSASKYRTRLACPVLVLVNGQPDSWGSCSWGRERASERASSFVRNFVSRPSRADSCTAGRGGGAEVCSAGKGRQEEEQEESQTGHLAWHSMQHRRQPMH